MSDNFSHRIDDLSKLVLVDQSHAEELFELTDSNREYLRQWLPWLDNNKYLQNTIDFIKYSQRQYDRNETQQYVVSYKDQLCGVVGFHRIDWLNRSTSIGYWLGENFQGKGLITKACATILDYSFGRMGLNRIEIRCATENYKSQAIPKRLGFKEEGLIRQAEWLYDHYVDHIVYGMLESEWNNNQRLVNEN